MFNKIVTYVALVLALVALAVGLSGSTTGSSVGAVIPSGGETITNTPNFATDVYITGSPRVATTTLKIYSSKTSNGSCVEMNATSSNQIISLRFVATSSIPGVTAPANFGGYVVWSYGKCQ